MARPILTFLSSCYTSIESAFYLWQYIIYNKDTKKKKKKAHTYMWLSRGFWESKQYEITLYFSNIYSLKKLVLKLVVLGIMQGDRRNQYANVNICLFSHTNWLQRKALKFLYCRAKSNLCFGNILLHGFGIQLITTKHEDMVERKWPFCPH